MIICAQMMLHSQLHLCSGDLSRSIFFRPLLFLLINCTYCTVPLAKRYVYICAQMMLHSKLHLW